MYIDEDTNSTCASLKQSLKQSIQWKKYTLNLFCFKIDRQIYIL